MKWMLRIGAGLAGILLLAVVVLFAMGLRADAGRAHASTEIVASRDQVWAWVDDPDKLKQWISWLVEVRTDPAHPTGIGAKRVLVMRDENNGGQLMEIEGTIREYARPQRLSMQLSSGGAFDGDSTYSLADLGTAAGLLSDWEQRPHAHGGRQPLSFCDVVRAADGAGDHPLRAKEDGGGYRASQAIGREIAPCLSPPPLPEEG